LILKENTFTKIYDVCYLYSVLFGTFELTDELVSIKEC